MALSTFCLAQAAAAAAKETAGEAAALPEGPTDFDTCVRFALRQSPFLTKSSMEIDLKRLDESDSRYGFIPALGFRTTYYVDRPTSQNVKPSPYTLSFTSEAYNPLEAYFSLQVKKLITEFAILSHLQVIANGLLRIGRAFLDLDTLKRVATCQDELISLARQNLNYAEKRLGIGTATSLEVKVAAQELELAISEKERILASQNNLLEGLKSFLGMKPAQDLTLNLEQVQRQVFGQFDPAATTLGQAKARSYDLKTHEIKKQLQAYNITLAKTRVLPNFLFGVTTPDPLSMTTAKGFFFYIGLEVPVWDGFKRIRNISRQKTLLRQIDVETETKESDLSGKWQVSLEDVRGAAASRKVAQAQEELGRLKERQNEIRYKSGGEPLTTFTEARKGYLESQKNNLLKALDYDMAVLSLRHLSGDLSYSYVQADSWQK
ncbi:MAG: TolC family protein [Desulfobaccales bacterium]|nr:TolC family protein [Desulfobaccales bacterium]